MTSPRRSAIMPSSNRSRHQALSWTTETRSVNATNGGAPTTRFPDAQRPTARGRHSPSVWAIPDHSPTGRAGGVVR
jgi:hypothetical protein